MTTIPDIRRAEQAARDTLAQDAEPWPSIPTDGDPTPVGITRPCPASSGGAL